MTYVNFKKLKDRVSLTRILEHYGLIESLTGTPQGYEGACPICGSDAFKANIEKNAWFCFGECKEKEEKNGGNILDLVARKEGVSVKKAAVLIASWFTEKPENAVSSEQQAADDAFFDNVAHILKEYHESVTPEQFFQDLRDAAASRETHYDYILRLHKEKQYPVGTTTTSEEALVVGAGDDEGRGDALVSPEPQTPVTAAHTKPVSQLTQNKPLTFTLKGIDPEHSSVIDAGMSDIDAARYGVGYFGGKGMMHDRIVFPFQNGDGEVLGYAGYSPKDGSWKYPPPEKFNPGLEVFGINEALQWNPPPGADPLVALFRDPLIALASAALWPNLIPIAVVSPELCERQMHLLEQLLEEGSKIRFAVPLDDSAVAEFLSELLPHYFVRLVRY